MSAVPITMEEQADFLIHALLEEHGKNNVVAIPRDMPGKRRLLRSLVNVRPPDPVSEDFLAVQDAYLKERLRVRGVTRLQDLTPVRPGLYLWQGDITTLVVDAIVNAANSQMLGCFAPCHACIDNAIHTYAGVQLRLECASIMEQQGSEEPTGRARITRAYNLPCRFVLHTVGPIVRGAVTEEDRELLASCYTSCLDLAAAHELRSVAFCCISTGVFHFPNRLAAKIAISTVETWQKRAARHMDVVFNVFRDEDYDIYKELLR